MYNSYAKSSVRKVRKRFWCKFKVVTVTHRRTHGLVNKLRQVHYKTRRSGMN
jgi:hypothetical protein